jgi:hypothetical protein
MTQDEMSNFADWLNRAYKRWCKTQPGEEDFLGFCDYIGVEPWKVLEWMRGVSEPQNGEVLCLAGIFGVDVFNILGLAKPDLELMRTYHSYSYPGMEIRNKVASTLWEAYVEITQKKLAPESMEAKAILTKSCEKLGFLVSKK